MKQSKQGWDGEREKCKIQLSGSVKFYVTRIVPRLIFLAVVVGAVCGWNEVEEPVTTWTAFILGFLTVALLRTRHKLGKGGKIRFLEPEVGGDESGYGSKLEYKSFLQLDLDTDFFKFFSLFSERVEAPSWQAAGPRVGWEDEANAHARKLGNIAAEARAVAARLNVAAWEAHAFAGQLPLLLAPGGEEELGLRSKATGNSVLSIEGMSTRTNALFEDPGSKPGDNSASGEAAYTKGLVTNSGGEKSSRKSSGTVDQDLDSDEVETDSEKNVAGLCRQGNSATCQADWHPGNVEDVRATAIQRAESFDCALTGMDDTFVASTRNKSARDGADMTSTQTGSKGLEEAHVEVKVGRETSGELLSFPTEHVSAANQEAWQKVDELNADMFEDIASEEATVRMAQVVDVDTSPVLGVPQDGMSFVVRATTSQQGRSRCGKIDDWQDDLVSIRKQVNETSPRTDVSYKTTLTDTWLQAEGSESTGVRPDGDVPLRTSSFRLDAPCHSSSRRPAGHRVTKSEGDFLFRKLVEGSMQESENTPSIPPNEASPDVIVKRSVRSKGIASRLRGALRSNAFSSSKVAPSKEHSSNLRKEDTMKTIVAPKREDVLQTNRNPSRSSSKADTNTKVAGNSIVVRRRLL